MQTKTKKIFLIIIFAIIIIFTLTTTEISFKQMGKHQIYYNMAQSPFSVKVSPFSYRILVPLIVNFIPIENKAGFQIITYFALLALILVMYEFLKIANIDDEKRIFFIMLFMLLNFYGFRYFIFNPFSVTHVSYLFLGILIILMIYQSNVLFSALFLISLLIKENALVILPVFFTFHAKKHGFRTALKTTAKFAFPPFLIYATFRFISFQSLWGSDIIESLIYYTKSRGIKGFLLIYTAGLIKVWGIISALILLEIKAVYKFIKENPWTLVLFLLTLIMPFFNSGAEFMLFYSFPAVVLWLNTAVKSLFKRYKIKNYYVLISFVIVAFIHNYLTMPQANIFNFGENIIINITFLIFLAFINVSGIIHSIFWFFKRKQKGLHDNE